MMDIAIMCAVLYMYDNRVATRPHVEISTGHVATGRASDVAQARVRNSITVSLLLYCY
jgi:hypothetical protein